MRVFVYRWCQTVIIPHHEGILSLIDWLLTPLLSSRLHALVVEPSILYSYPAVPHAPRRILCLSSYGEDMYLTRGVLERRGWISPDAEECICNMHSAYFNSIPERTLGGKISRSGFLEETLYLINKIQYFYERNSRKKEKWRGTLQFYQDARLLFCFLESSGTRMIPVCPKASTRKCIHDVQPQGLDSSSIGT